jgi:hypothetical protein
MSDGRPTARRADHHRPSDGTTIEDEFAALAPEEQPVGVMFSTVKPEPAL